MEGSSLVLTEPLGLLLLPLVAMLLMALCVRCRELPDSCGGAGEDRLHTESILFKPPQALAPWPIPYPLPSQTDLLHIPRSPQPLGGAHQMPSSRQDSDGANSVASYENQEPACEDADEDEDEEDYPNDGYGGYVEVLPDGAPAPSSGVDPVEAPVPSKSGLRDRAVSVEFREDYVNVPESEESAEASLDGSREYVNVSQELQPAAGAVPAALSTQEDEDEDEDEGEDGDAPDYENLQELS
ncbi:linker for activation of T-cells family member 1 [Fukomys damarensis]|uniref:linker for activation of T-cells family member 1 n=1 Tax=Fukomys damarensis TaxID=885580 RepID=UPI00053F5D69|nr:linker for activation of T-cells family member 1 [Fukomys damarensis]XP_033614603.1 linker for activation of T-cells family member 1 [Fukomys damarensis]